MIPLTVLSHSPPLPTNPNPNPIVPNPYRLQCRCSSRDPNAESVRSGRFRFRDEQDDGRRFKRRWWSDDEFGFDPFQDDDDDDEEEDVWDRVWIFKVFKSYGYLLPALIASTLLATGPKAFLMALALPLAQSAFSLAIEKVWGKAQESPRTKPKYKKKPFARSTGFRKQEQEENDSDSKDGPGYQSWASTEDRDSDKGNSNSSSFGGWDDLDKQRGSTREQQTTSAWSAQPEPVKKGKLSKRGNYKDVPLLFRLLIAVFPFLGSWTRIM